MRTPIPYLNNSIIHRNYYYYNLTYLLEQSFFFLSSNQNIIVLCHFKYYDTLSVDVTFILFSMLSIIQHTTQPMKLVQIRYLRL